MDKKLTTDEMEKMPIDQLKLYYDWAKRDLDSYQANRSGYTHISIFGVNFMTPGGRGAVVKKIECIIKNIRWRKIVSATI